MKLTVRTSKGKRTFEGTKEEVDAMLSQYLSNDYNVEDISKPTEIEKPKKKKYKNVKQEKAEEPVIDKPEEDGEA